MRKYLWTNNRITSILCHSWWRWCLFYFRTKIIVDTNAKYFPHQSWRVYIWRRQIYSTLDFFWVFLEKSFFSPKFELLNLGCSLSASAAYLRVFTVLFYWSMGNLYKVNELHRSAWISEGNNYSLLFYLELREFLYLWGCPDSVTTLEVSGNTWNQWGTQDQEQTQTLHCS